jgi:hypothetical protein
MEWVLGTSRPECAKRPFRAFSAACCASRQISSYRMSSDWRPSLARARLLSALPIHARHASPLIDHASIKGFTVDETGSISILLDSVGVFHNHVDWGRDVGEF